MNMLKVRKINDIEVNAIAIFITLYCCMICMNVKDEFIIKIRTLITITYLKRISVFTCI